MTTTSRIAIFASGSGTNAEAIMTHFRDHESITVAALLSNNPDAYALVRAQRFEVPVYVFDREAWKTGDAIRSWLHKQEVTHVVLAGFLWLVPDYLIKVYPGKIINIHPALLPGYGGKGMYGMKVHEAVRAAGEKETGITIHVVNEKYDEGEVVFQARCAVANTDTAEEIAAKVHALEYAHFAPVIEQWIEKNR